MQTTATKLSKEKDNKLVEYAMYLENQYKRLEQKCN